MPSSRQALRIRSAISPRFAMTILSSMARLFDDGLFDYRLFDDEKRLAELHRFAIPGKDRGHAAVLVRFDLVHHLHRFDDAERLTDLHFTADLDKGLGARSGRGIEGADHGRGHDVFGGWRSFGALGRC